MIDASLNGIEVEEDVTYPSVRLVVKAKECDPGTGNAVRDIDWHLRCDDSRISKVEKKIHSIPR